MRSGEEGKPGCFISTPTDWGGTLAWERAEHLLPWAASLVAPAGLALGEGEADWSPADGHWNRERPLARAGGQTCNARCSVLGRALACILSVRLLPGPGLGATLRPQSEKQD